MIAAQEERRHHDHRSRCLSAIGIRFLSILFPPRIPPLSRSAYRPEGRTRRGFHVPRIRDTAGEGALYTRDQRCSHDRPVASGRRLPPLPAAGSYHPGSQPVFPGFK